MLLLSLLFAAALLCSLVAGFLFAFAVVTMPGIARLSDAEFVRSFQAIDGVIQRNQPLFGLVWVGSIVALLAAAAFGLPALNGADRLLLGAATLLYVVGVQIPTFTVNVPANNRIQSVDTATADASAVKRARDEFEGRWNRSNVARTVFAVLVSALLLLLLLRVQPTGLAS